MTKHAERPRGWPLFFVFLLGCALGFPSLATAQSGQDYKLGVQDRLRIRVVEWQPIDGTFKEWSAVGGEYTVGASGALSIPFVGEASVTGKTTAEVASLISGTLQRKFGLSDRPETSVELAAYRPIYVSGDVRNAGQFPFAPGLNVVKAVSLAGGTRDGVGLRTERDYIQAKGNYETTADQRIRLTVRAARLEAEAAGSDKLTLPKELQTRPGIDDIVAEETAIMTTRQRKVGLQLQALSELQTLLENEIVTLQKKAETQQRQKELAQKELEGVGSLANKGLVSNTRLLTAERVLAEIETNNLDLETSILRARQDISKAKQDEINVRNTLESEIASERQEVEAGLKEAQLKMDTYRALISEAIQAGDSAVGDDEPRTVYTIVRTADGKAEELSVDETSDVQPGDVIKVRTVLPEPVLEAGQ